MGVAGAQEKCDYVVGELGFDACVSHRSDTLRDDLKGACPDGVDVYFENVGGKVFEAVLPLLNTFSRMPVCGRIANYNLKELPAGPDRTPALMGLVLTRRITVRGFIVFDHNDRQPDFLRDVRCLDPERRVEIPRGRRRRPRARGLRVSGAPPGQELREAPGPRVSRPHPLVAIRQEPAPQSVVASAKRPRRFPDSLVLLFALIVLAQLATYVLPAGEFERNDLLVVPGTYEPVDADPLHPLRFLTAIPEGLAAAQDIIFFVFIVGGVNRCDPGHGCRRCLDWCSNPGTCPTVPARWYPAWSCSSRSVHRPSAWRRSTCRLSRYWSRCVWR